MKPLGEKAAWRMVREPHEEDDGFVDAPHGELQSQIDWLERDYEDEPPSWTDFVDDLVGDDE